MPTKSDSSIVNLVNSDGCFDLQFRKDTRHERTNSPTYYRWKAQFVLTSPKANAKILEKVKRKFCCGETCISGSQARFSVQKIDDISKTIVPFFRKNALSHNKKKDFELWIKGVDVIYKNKGKPLSGWAKHDICTLIEIHKSSAKYKTNPRQSKWLQMAQALVKTNNR